MTLKNYKLIFLLAPLVCSFAIAMDLYLPIVPHMQSILSASQKQIQLTLSLFIVTFGVGQLFLGPLSDCYGRRKIVIISILIYCISPALLAMAANITIFILLRIIQAIGACGSMVIAFSIVKDMESPNVCAKTYSYLNGVISLSPLLGPLLGSHLYLLFGWKSCFIFLSIVGFLSFALVSLKLPESLPVENRTKLSTNIFGIYATIFRNFNFLTFALSSSIGFTSFFSFFSCPPYLLIEKLQFSLQQFGYCFGLISLVFFFGCLISAKLCVKVSVLSINILGARCLFLAGTAMAVSYYLFGLNLVSFLVPMVFVALGAALVIGSGTAGAMASFSSNTGAVSAALGCFQFLFAALVAMLMMQTEITSSIPLATTVFSLSIMILTMHLYRALRKNDQLVKA